MGFVAVGDASKLYGQAIKLIVSLAFHRFSTFPTEPFVDDVAIKYSFKAYRKHSLLQRDINGEHLSILHV